MAEYRCPKCGELLKTHRYNAARELGESFLICNFCGAVWLSEEAELIEADSRTEDFIDKWNRQ